MIDYTRMKLKNMSGKGFTLMEVLVAVLILGLAYVAVMQNFSVSLMNIGRIDAHRSDLMDFTMAVEQQMSNGDGDETGSVFLEGGKYRLMLIDGDDGRLMTLKLERLH